MSDTGLELVVCCARTELDEWAVRRMEVILSEEVDWQRIWQLSAVHAVQPLVYKSLANHFAGQVPENVLTSFKRPYLQSAMENLRLGNEMARVLDVLRAHDVKALPFKGPVLAETAYGSLGLRRCGDIDLLILPDRYEQVERILQKDGYQLPPKVRQLRPVQKRAHLYITRQYPFIKPGNYFIDLHTGIMPVGYNFPFTLERLWERSRSVAVAGSEVRDCQPEDTLLILCYQGLKNLWERLKHICDVAEVVRSHPELDWDVILERAQSMHGERILLLGLHLAHAVSGGPLPDRVLRLIEKDAVVAELAEQVMQVLTPDREEEIDLSWRLRLHMKAQHHWSTKLRYGAYAAARRVEELYEEAAPATTLPEHAA